jgi:hypothetical protein
MKRKILALVMLIGFLSIGAAAPVRMTPVKITEGVYVSALPGLWQLNRRYHR